MRKKKFLLAAGACLAVMALTTPLAIADPTNAPQFRALAGVGSDTTQDVLNGLANGTGPPQNFPGIMGDDPNIPGVDNTRLVASYDAGPLPLGNITTKGPGFPSPTPPPPDDGDCTFTRPSGSTNGVRALVRERARVAVQDGRPCLDFARSSADTSLSPEFNGAGLTYIPFATDSVMYVTRSGSTISRNLTTAQLQTIYTDSAPCLPNFRPLLPQPGSGTRAFFLQSIGVSELGGPAPNVGNCVSDRDPTNPAVGLLENTGNLLTDNRHIAPYSVAQYIAQFTGTIDDVTGRTLKRNANGIRPVIRNSLHIVVYTTRSDSTIPRSLPPTGPNSLQTIYTDNAPCATNFRPLLPPPGSQARLQWLLKLSITEAQVGNCVTTVGVENDGRVMNDRRNIYPYNTDAYLDQLAGAVDDVRGLAVTRSLIIGITVKFPHLLNPAASFTRPVFNVVPTSKLGQHPTSTVFVGGGSAVCTNSAVISRFGFATRDDCGDTSRQTPGGPTLP